MTKVSVVVPTVDRVSLLDRCLDGLAAQDGVGHEVIVVHDGEPAIVELLDRRAARGDLPLRAVRVEARAAAAKRNAGWRAAAGDVIAFTDDDCAPAPGWLAAGAAAFADGVDLVQGRIAPHPDDAGNQGTFARTLQVSKLDETFPTANAFYRRSALERAGGFDERFPNAAGEDTDLAWTVLEGGGQAVFAPDALVHHAVHPFGFVDHLRSLPRWGDLHLVLRKHPDVRRLTYRRFFWKRTHPAALLALVGLAGAVVDRRALALVVPHLARRVRRDGPVVGLQLAAVDLAETAVMIGGTIRHRTVLL